MERTLEVNKKELIVSVSYTYINDTMDAVSNVYVFADDGLVKTYPNTKSHEKALQEFDIDGCYDWYFRSKNEFETLLYKWCEEEMWHHIYTGIEDINSYVAGNLSFFRYYDCNVVSMNEGYIYKGTDRKSYYYMGCDENLDSLFVLAEDVILKEDGVYQLYKNIDVITYNTGITIAMGIHKIRYKKIDEKKIFLFFED